MQLVFTQPGWKLDVIRSYLGSRPAKTEKPILRIAQKRGDVFILGGCEEPCHLFQDALHVPVASTSPFAHSGIIIQRLDAIYIYV
jgi:hypothetical protein